MVIDLAFMLFLDMLGFNMEIKVVDFLGLILIDSDMIKLYCEDGFYDIENNVVEFIKNV